MFPAPFATGVTGTEEDLRRLASIVAYSDDAIVGKSLDGTITSWNAGAERIYGYSASEALGQSITMLVPADRPNECLDLENVIKNGECVDHFETIRVRKDGRLFPTEITESPIRDAVERIVGAFAIGPGFPCAGRRNTRPMEARYRGLLEAAPDAMVIVNEAGEIILLNLQAETQFGYRRDELLGQQVSNIIPEGFAERLLTRGVGSVADPLVPQMGTGIELYGRRKNGTDFPIEIMLSPLSSVDGTLVTAAIRDITRRRRHEDDVPFTPSSNLPSTESSASRIRG